MTVTPPTPTPVQLSGSEPTFPDRPDSGGTERRDPERFDRVLPGVQMLRACAALLVVIRHVGHDYAALAGVPQETTIFNVFDWNFGVDIFFVISGFIMLYANADWFGRRGAPTAFLLRRVIRIVPLYWAATTVVLAVGLALPALLNAGIGGPAHVVASYLFVPSLRAPGQIEPVLSLGWTLNFEMFFYVSFALVLLLPLERGLLALAGLLGALMVVGALVHPTDPRLQTWTHPLLAEFLAGVAIAELRRRGLRISPATAAILLAAGIATAFLTAPVLAPFIGLPRLPVAILAAGLIVAAAALTRDTHASSAWWPLILLGDASYSLYLVHPFVIRPITVAWARLVGAPPPLAVYGLVCCVAAILAAILVHHVFERPALRRLRTMAGHHAATPRAAGAELTSH